MTRREISKIKFSGEQFSNTLLAYVDETTSLLAAIENSSTSNHGEFIDDMGDILLDIEQLAEDIQQATEKELERLEGNEE